MALDFYHGHGSPFSWKVHLALEHKRIPYTLKVLSFQNEDTKKPEFKAINPRGHVPTIVDDGHALWESAVILEYLDERFAQGDKLFPGDMKARARVRRLAREADEYLYKEGVALIADEYFWKKEPPDEDQVAKWREKVAQELEYFAGELRGEYLAGNAPSAADFALYPYVAFCKRITFRKPQSKLTDAIPAKLGAWAKRIESQPYFDTTYPPHWR